MRDPMRSDNWWVFAALIVATSAVVGVTLGLLVWSAVR